MSYHLCVDCGGSKTAAAVADADGNIVGRGVGGPSNFAYIGLDNFMLAVSATIAAALQPLQPLLLPSQSQSQPQSEQRSDVPLLPPPADRPLFASAWFGVSGVDSAAAIARLVPPLTALLGVEPIVANDTHLLASPLGMHADVSAAIGCVSGTGGIVVSFRQASSVGARAGTGTRTEGGLELEELGRVGGWGWILGDEGGGFHVGREAVRQILWEADCASVLAHEKRITATESVLKDRVLAHFAVNDVFELLTVVHWPDPHPSDGEGKGAKEGSAPAYTKIVREKRLSQLAPMVFAAAFEERDPLALRVLRLTSAALVDEMCVLLRPEEDEDGRAYPERKVKASETILCFGGSLVGVEAYRQLIFDELKRRGHVMRRWTFVEDAAGTGAKALAAVGKARAR